MNYSIASKDASGVTAHTEFLPFDDDDAATQFARTEHAKYPLVEVWKNDQLVLRLERGSPASA